MARHVFHEALREQGNDNDRRALYPDWAMTDYNQLTHIITFVSEEGGDTFDSLAETVGFLRVGCRDAGGKGGSLRSMANVNGHDLGLFRRAGL